MNGELEFQYPWVLALLGLLPVYALLRGKVGRLSALVFSSADIARAAGAQARSAPGRLLLFLRLLVVALTIGALAGPRLANYHVETETPGIDIMLVLDLSWSMMAVDMGKPAEKLSRFAIASSVLKDFVAKRPNDRIGLISFSGVPYLTSPLTLNHTWLGENLARLLRLPQRLHIRKEPREHVLPTRHQPRLSPQQLLNPLRRLHAVAHKRRQKPQNLH